MSSHTDFLRAAATSIKLGVVCHCRRCGTAYTLAEFIALEPPPVVKRIGGDALHIPAGGPGRPEAVCLYRHCTCGSTHAISLTINNEGV